MEALASRGLEATVLGLGCAACQHFHRLVVDTRADLGLEAGVDYVTDPSRLQDLGSKPLPALLINGKVALADRVPAPGELEAILAAAPPGLKAQLPPLRPRLAGNANGLLKAGAAPHQGCWQKAGGTLTAAAAPPPSGRTGGRGR